jgi:NAD-dependent SIR2 family protein deacetylase
MQSAFEEACPTQTHRFIKLLDERGFLQRCYTQNVDGLLEKAGLNPEKLVNCHGSFVDKSVVLYGDDLPQRFHDLVLIDLCKRPETPCDLAIVIGTSLAVYPFRNLPNKVPKRTCTRVLVDLFPQKVDTGGPQFKGPGFRNKRVKLAANYWRTDMPWSDQRVFAMDCDTFSSGVISGMKKFSDE